MKRELRLAELLAPLSLVSDLGTGLPAEQAMRSCVLAVELARRLGFDASSLCDVYYAALLQDIGCTASSPDLARFVGGDDLLAKGLSVRTDFTNPREAMAFMGGVTEGLPPLRRAGVLVRNVVLGSRAGKGFVSATCEVAAVMAERLGLPPPVREALGHIFEQWDGKGEPKSISGESISPVARVVQVSYLASLLERLEGAEAALEVIARRAGKALDPDVCRVLLDAGEDLLLDLFSSDVFAGVLEGEPEPRRLVDERHLDSVAAAFADMVDLKCTYTLGHSREVARLAEEAGRSVGLDEGAVVDLRRAGLFHDLGRVGVTNGIWDKPGPLTTAEWETVRLHPYHTGRILERSPLLAPLASVAAGHHERQDGSGYHQQLSGSAISMPARVLAAADVYQAITQSRPHRPESTPDQSADTVVGEASAGRLDPDAARAVCEAGGHVVPPLPREFPRGLTEREVEVLRLLATGRSTREIARSLFIAEKTAGNHIQHIYAKIEASTRAAAAMFAMKEGLV